MKLSRRNLRTFTAVVDMILPAVPGDGPAWTTPGADLGLSDQLPEIFASLPHDQVRKDFRKLLRLLSSRIGGLVLYGKPQKFHKLSPSARADAYRTMEGRRLSLVRGGAKGLKLLAAFLWVTTDDPATRPIAWDAMGYPGPSGPPPTTEKTIAVENITSDTTIEVDVVIVGSGAGGGTAAGVLAEAGLKVAVLEKGGYSNESDFSHLEIDAYRKMYLDGALSSSADGSVQVLSGATLGGGTVINYTTAFATPHRLREEWDRVGGFTDVFESVRYEQSSAAVLKRLDVNTVNGSPSSRDQLMVDGLRANGWRVEEQPRNAQGCTGNECGYCTMGCRIGAKRSTLKTYLQDAAAHGATFITGADVSTVEVEGGKATGVVATVNGHTVRVKARAVVVAAGALNTPALLLRSGLGGPAAGKYLRLHPVTAVWGRFKDKIDPWSGVLQARYGAEFADLDGKGFGVIFETAPIHPLFPAAYLGWDDGGSFKRDVLGLAHLSVAGILVRDREPGRVTIRKDGTPVWHYRVSKYDQKHVREGVMRSAEWLAAAGAEEVFTSSIRPARWLTGSGSIAAFMDHADAIGYGPNRTTYVSLHQMGSARMGSDPAESVVDDNNETHDTQGLYVLDGSCFPNASGVNPMISIATIAHRGASLLVERLA